MSFVSLWCLRLAVRSSEQMNICNLYFSMNALQKGKCLTAHFAACAPFLGLFASPGLAHSVLCSDYCCSTLYSQSATWLEPHYPMKMPQAVSRHKDEQAQSSCLNPRATDRPQAHSHQARHWGWLRVKAVTSPSWSQMLLPLPGTPHRITPRSMMALTLPGFARWHSDSSFPHLESCVHFWYSSSCLIGWLWQWGYCHLCEKHSTISLNWCYLHARAHPPRKAHAHGLFCCHTISMNLFCLEASI